MMKNNMLEYKGYHTVIEFDSEKMVLRGKVEGINDFVNFESDSPTHIEQEFHNAVDDYLDFCKEVNKEPDKEYKGIFNVRIPSELHRKITLLALQQHTTLNQFVINALNKAISN